MVINFDGRLYSAEAIQKAAYKSSNYFTVDIALDAGVIECKLIPNNGISSEQFDWAVEDFRKEVLDQQLRLKIKAETEPVRNLILGIAFSNTGLQDSE